MILSLLIIIGIVFLILGLILSSKYDNIFDICISFKNNKRVFHLCFIIYLIVLNVSLLLFIYRSETYVRPLSYFFILSLGVIPILIEIFYMPEKKTYTVIIILQILVIPFSYISLLNGLYPTILGHDPWSHIVFVEEMISLGHIEFGVGSETIYKHLPVFHLNIVSFSLITSSGYKLSSLISIGFSSLIITLLSIYILIRNFFNPRIALLSILIVGVSNNFLEMIGVSIIPSSIGTALAILVFMLLIKKDNNKLFLGLIFVFAFVINITHSLSYIFLLLQSISIVIFARTYKVKIFLNNLRIFIALLALGLSYWFLITTYYGRHIIRNIMSIIAGDTTGHVSTDSQVSVSLRNLFIGRLGIILFAAFSILGLLWIFYKERGYKQYALLGVGGFALGFSILSFLSPHFMGIGHRFWFYMQITCGVAVVIGIFLITAPSIKFNVQKYIVVFIVFGLTLVMLTSPVINNDNPFINYYGSTRTGLKESEVSVAEFVTTNIAYTKTINTDDYYGRRRIEYYYGSRIYDLENRSTIRIPLGPNELPENEGYILIRDEIFTNGVIWREEYQSIDMSKEEYLLLFEKSRNNVYDNGEVLLYAEETR